VRLLNPRDRQLFANLTDSERAYASAYADTIALGDPSPARPADGDPAVAGDIRAALLREWRARLDRSPALSGRLKIERRSSSG
jgi:hypothetical protein